MTSTFTGMAQPRFVSLTTFRRSGAPVATQVWVARDGDTLVVTTPAASGKVKRLRHDPRVELRPCSRRGVVQDGAPMVNGVAKIVGPDERSTEALRRKYGLEFRIVTALEWLLTRGGRERVILRITSG